MKKIFTTVIALVLLLSLCACEGKTAGSKKETVTPEPTATPKPDIDASTVDIIGETWVVTELSFDSVKEYNTSKAEQSDIIMDAVFTNKDSGTTLTLPAFWDGDNNFKVRFAPTEYGVWEYKTVCETDDSLNGKTGTIGANEYKGYLDVYKHGFIKAESGNKYFTYADGTPFFYLGDTHWTMFKEEFDSLGASAGNIQADSHFKYIVDKRVEQGFTVYQSEPIDSPFNLADGNLNKSDIKGFQTADKYFQYLAEKGLVHANAQFFFSSATFMTEKLANNTEYLEKISRYWVARFGAYPVMWTLGQEIDNDRYAEHGDQKFFTPETNPWVKIAEYLHKYDAYAQPLTGHQEHYARTTVTGYGADKTKASDFGKSAFSSDEVTAKTGHNWYGAQWSAKLNTVVDFRAPKDYWDSTKVAIDYECSYCYQDTKDFGARVHGWLAYLNGFFGYGYGAIDMWFYNSTYESNEKSNDGYEDITPEDKKTKWSTAVEFESGYQLGYMKKFFESVDWWKLVPDFDNGTYFKPAKNAYYSCATIQNELYVVCFYNQTTDTGSLLGLDTNGEYTAQWFNTKTNEYTDIGNVTADKKGTYEIPQKEEKTDCVLIVKKK